VGLHAGQGRRKRRLRRRPSSPGASSRRVELAGHLVSVVAVGVARACLAKGGVFAFAPTVVNRRYQTLPILLYKDPPRLATIFQTSGLYSLEAGWSFTLGPLLEMTLL
jgi:hypothetical protein